MINRFKLITYYIKALPIYGVGWFYLLSLRCLPDAVSDFLLNLAGGPDSMTLLFSVFQRGEGFRNRRGSERLGGPCDCGCVAMPARFSRASAPSAIFLCSSMSSSALIGIVFQLQQHQLIALNE
jgi:hypothetical protein